MLALSRFGKAVLWSANVIPLKRKPLKKIAFDDHSKNMFFTLKRHVLIEAGDKADGERVGE
jgi:hypothetical protein